MIPLKPDEIRGRDTIKDWLQQSCGLFFPVSKHSILTERLRQVQRDFHFADLNEVADALTHNDSHDLKLALVHLASTNHTHFFRETTVLENFSDLILPSVARQEKVTIWSAASSTGEEAYTLAMILADQLGLNVATSRFRILGTDLSAKVVETASNGVYSSKQVADVSLRDLAAYFKKDEKGNFQIIQPLKEMCMFRRLNLIAPSYPFRNRFDIVFCRNVLYYFTAEDQQKVLKNIHTYTKPGGWLVTSVTEPMHGLSQYWEMVEPAIYRRIGMDN